jgi:hypothetical protein
LFVGANSGSIKFERFGSGQVFFYFELNHDLKISGFTLSSCAKVQREGFFSARSEFVKGFLLLNHLRSFSEPATKVGGWKLSLT